MAGEEGLRALEREVVRAAEERAGEIESHARARADEMLRLARNEGEAQGRQLVSEVRQQGTRERARIEAAAHLEARRRGLAAREAVIAHALAEARARLEEGLRAEERRAALEKAVLEAATALHGGRLRVSSSPQDAPFLTPDLLQGLARRLGERGLAVELEPGPPASILGGAIVSGDGGGVVLDNSFDARLSRQAWELRNEIWQTLAEVVPEAELVH